MDNQGEFTADKEMVDSLKLDASILTPKQERQVKIVARQVASEFTSMYSQFIPPDTLEKTKGIEDRILITKNDAFGIMYTDWDSEHLVPSPFNKALLGLCFTKGGIMALDDPRNLWNKFPKNVQEELSQEYGSEAKAKQRIMSGCLVDSITHEMVHQFQDNYLPDYFLECAVRYYQRQISDRLRMGHPIEDLTEERISFYKQMTKEFGDNMHHLFFGGNDSLARNTILARFNQEKERLFPQGQGLCR